MNRWLISQQPFHSAILWIPDNVDIRFYDLSYWVPEHWDTQGGGVVLAGDAAHSMPPNRGQGLNHAINDAYNIVATIKKLDHDEKRKKAMMESYRDEVVERGAKETRLSRDTAFATLDYDKFKESGIMKHGLARSPDDA
jgi:2-polyprenyl-6-methoxyphenol hydroxylase-like FAD-dependent oxidoreductase